MRKTLPIKKVHFDAIRAGEKRYEYREKKPFYDRFFKVKPTQLLFHYYREQRLLCDVLSIDVIDTPIELGQKWLSSYGTKPEKLYRIEVKAV